MGYVKTRFNTLRNQLGKAKRHDVSGSEGITPKKHATYLRQLRYLAFLEPHQRKRPSLTNIVRIVILRKKNIEKRLKKIKNDFICINVP